MEQCLTSALQRHHGRRGAKRRGRAGEKHKPSPNLAWQSFAFGEVKRKGSNTPKSRKQRLEPYKLQSSFIAGFVLLGVRRCLNQPCKLNYFQLSGAYGQIPPMLWKPAPRFSQGGWEGEHETMKPVFSTAVRHHRPPPSLLAKPQQRQKQLVLFLGFTFPVGLAEVVERYHHIYGFGWVFGCFFF